MLKSISLRLCTLIVLLFAGISSFAQQVQVKGTVVEKSSGESIIGASVMEVGSNSNGTITDIDGNFTLSVASGATLSVSYIGYKAITGTHMEGFKTNDEFNLKALRIIFGAKRAGFEIELPELYA